MGRSASVQQPRKRLFEKFSLITILKLHVYGDFINNVEEKSQHKMPFVVKQKEDMMTDHEKSCMTMYLIQLLHSHVRRPPGHFHSWLFWSWWLLRNLAFSTYRDYFVSSSDLWHLATVNRATCMPTESSTTTTISFAWSLHGPMPWPLPFSLKQKKPKQEK